MSHEHSWTPVATEVGRYRCACGSTGWRTSDGEIKPHRKTLQIAVEVSAANRPIDELDIYGRVRRHGGQP